MCRQSKRARAKKRTRLLIFGRIDLFLGAEILPLDFEIQHWREKVYL
jgi:hypothetical protein